MYPLAIALEIILLYFGFSFLLLGYMPMRHRVVGSAVLFPLAALACLWSGSLHLRKYPPPAGARPRLIRTFPVLLFLGTCAVAFLFLVLAVTGEL
jgi:hypothetical protein